jgi:hypothetical protein
MGASAAYLAVLASGGDPKVCDPAGRIVDGLRERAGRADRESTSAFHAAINGSGEPAAAMEQRDDAAEPDGYEHIDSPIVGMDSDPDEAFLDSLPDSACRRAPGNAFSVTVGLVKRGRKPKFTEAQKEAVRGLYSAGIRVADIAHSFGMSKGHVYYTLRQGKKTA